MKTLLLTYISALIRPFIIKISRFKWSLHKTLDFMQFRRNDLELRTNFFNQLQALENKLIK